MYEQVNIKASRHHGEYRTIILVQQTLQGIGHLFLAKLDISSSAKLNNSETHRKCRFLSVASSVV